MAIKKRYTIVTLLAFWAASFAIFWIVSVYAGGDSMNGKIEDGRYYFGSHGQYTEVSQMAYVLSASYTTILFASVSFFVLFIFCFMIKRGITIKDLKEDLLNLLILVPLIVGLGFLYGTFLSLKCILQAFGII